MTYIIVIYLPMLYYWGEIIYSTDRLDIAQQDLLNYLTTYQYADCGALQVFV